MVFGIVKVQEERKGDEGKTNKLLSCGGKTTLGQI